MAGMSEASQRWATSGSIPNGGGNTYGAEGNTLRPNEQMMGSGVETRIPAGQFSTPPSYGSPATTQPSLQQPSLQQPSGRIGQSAWDTPPMFSGTVPAPSASAIQKQRSQSSVGTPRWTPQAGRAGYNRPIAPRVSALQPMQQTPEVLTNITSPSPSAQSMFSKGTGLFGEERYGNI